MFSGYPAPGSNTTHTPNQFFDVVLPYSSRGVVRLVAYLIRRTLGWCDKQGNPVNEQVSVSFNDFIEGAGISRGGLKKAIDEAIESGFIRCAREGQPSRAGLSAVSAMYELNWDEDTEEYIRDPEVFQGFFAGNGNYTYIPNAYFDYTVRYETLAVAKVVGSIIRNTIGFQTRRGFRRQQVAMSFTDIQNYVRIGSRRALNEALKHALDEGHLVLVEDGQFGGSVKAAKYGICWMDEQQQDADNSPVEGTGSKRIPEDPDRPVQKGYQKNRFKKDTSEPNTGSKGIPEPVQKGYQERFKKDTSHIVNKTLNKTSKQQHVPETPSNEVEVTETVVVEEVILMESFRRLRDGGFDEKTALDFAKNYSPEIIKRQCEWISQRGAAKNSVGMLRRSIESDWGPPETSDSESAQFAKRFYAELAGNDKKSLAPVSSTDLRAAETFFHGIREIRADFTPIDLARALIKFARRFETADSKEILSLRATLTRYADRFAVHARKQEETRQRNAREASRKAHQEQNAGEYEAYVVAKLSELQQANTEPWQAFEKWESEGRAIYESPSSLFSEKMRKQMLKDFDTQERRTERFLRYFTEERKDGVVAKFWEWDEQENASPLPSLKENR
jgi:hypothetical protein